MQIVPSLPGSPPHRVDAEARGVNPGAAPAAPRAAAGVADATTARAAPARPALTRGLKDFDLSRQSGVAGAQLAGVYLDRLQQGLQALRQHYTAQLGADTDQPTVSAPAADALRAGLKATWSQRARATAGALDAQLRIGEPGQARQDFHIRGLSRHALTNGSREVLTVVTGNAPAPLTATLDPELGTAANLRRLDQALAPVGVRVRADDAGEPVFSVPEAEWPRFHDRVLIKGEGRRFPDGQAQAVRTPALPSALGDAVFDAPGAEPASLREALGRVTVGIAAVTGAQQRAQAVLIEQHQGLQHAGHAQGTVKTTPERARHLAEGFALRLREAGFARYEAVAPTVAGISRERVRSLLG